MVVDSRGSELDILDLVLSRLGFRTLRGLDPEEEEGE